MTVLVCGYPLNNKNSICLLPPRHEGFTHASLGIGDVTLSGGTSLAILAVLYNPNTDEEVEMWQLRELVPGVPNE